jgi:phosphatidylglycerophosphatase C
MALAFFDLDGTLTKIDTFVPYCVTALIHRPLRMFRVAAVIRGLVRFMKGDIDSQSIKETLVSVFLGGAAREDIDRWNKIFLHKVFPALLRQTLLLRARNHQKMGDRVFIVSASPDIYLEPFVRQWRFDGLICTTLEFKEMRLSGKILGRNCRGEEKARRIRALFTHAELDGSSGYGNSGADKQMLELVSVGYFVSRAGLISHRL